MLSSDKSVGVKLGSEKCFRKLENRIVFLFLDFVTSWSLLAKAMADEPELIGKLSTMTNVINYLTISNIFFHFLSVFVLDWGPG